MRTLLMTVAGVLSLVTWASAQPVTTFADLSLRLNVGDEVSVEDRSGAVTSGRIERLTSEEFAVASRTGAERVFSSASVRLVQKRGDPLGNGMRLGAIIGGAVGGALSSVFSGEFRGGDLVQGVAFFGAAGLGLGLVFDAAHVGRTTVFSAPTVSARSGRHDGGRAALHATFRW